MERPDMDRQRGLARSSNERGAILVTSLLLLLVLTVLGVSMMKMTNMQERMSGNTRDMNLALQAAEAGLRDGESQIDPFTIINVPTPTGGFGCVICQPGALPIAIDNPTLFDWAMNGILYGSASGRPAIFGLTDQPRYKIEEIAFIEDSLINGQEYYEDGRFFYQVSARSSGASGLANVVLQSTYARPK
jgi:type IV pilus assembly protein PilX